uniref:hypothetical protein n=1 Tax=Armatimonas sp. TaxID=1872638 RepID=UPI00286B3738
MKQETKELQSRIAATHGLAKLTSLRQEAAMEVRVMGMKGPSVSSRLIFDLKNHRGRIEFIENGKLIRLYQETAEGRVFWTAKAGRTALGPAKVPFDFVPNMQSGLMGAIALGNTRDAIQIKQADAIGKQKGTSLTRTQTARLIPLMQGRGDLTLESCESVWTYLIAADGTLLAERVVQTAASNSKKRVVQEFYYDRFETISGVKVPVELGVK